ncbi:WXG100 family type VII secretion target [Schaalia sp. 19OD2882]|uniref:WXG100 family type VII secretion target n=1 Tax=Schaalia sp. 19OD2882 TaxID=2794089 RepID=UPI001C1EB22E|nr:WXG100 family type VII secretion target [Schaalia sp. 19OD2882]QWW19828.1 WXG100 family type VII secretion target [Schaalia sp. 19OD2882]
MAQQIAAQDGAILKGAETVESTQAELQQLISTLRGQMESIGGKWQGASAGAFQQLMVRWDEEAKKVTGALTGFAENLRGSQKNFDSTDTGQSDAFTHFQATLG